MRPGLAKEIARNVTACLVSITFLSGCAAPKMNTGSGRPEVVILADRTKPRAALVRELVNKRFLITDEREIVLVAEGDAGGAAAFWFTDLRSGERPTTRLRFNLLEQEGSTRVIANAKLVRPYYKAEMDYTNPNVSRQLQWLLDCVAADVEGRERPPEPPVEKVDARPPKAK